MNSIVNPVEERKLVNDINISAYHFSDYYNNCFIGTVDGVVKLYSGDKLLFTAKLSEFEIQSILVKDGKLLIFTNNRILVYNIIDQKTFIPFGIIEDYIICHIH